MQAVRLLADARQHVSDVREASARDVEVAKAKAAADVAAAELDDVKAWDAALRAGWQVTELRRIGFTEAEKRARVRRRRTAAASAPTSAPSGGTGHPSSPATDAGHITGAGGAAARPIRAADNTNGARHA